jgi:hypothetical protein
MPKWIHQLAKKRDESVIVMFVVRTKDGWEGDLALEAWSCFTRQDLQTPISLHKLKVILFVFLTSFKSKQQHRSGARDCTCRGDVFVTTH